ncbi:adenosylmethionine-8-amino-7-oxononanoate aminotransferase [Bradyrhizobium sp. CIR18]|uniref:aminotransferase class III-fold pyridoxal phosphate-dependent enzyme n=1 Tax=Bradyrhizobium sp. CIR18 TaxID=2663839 RepID=UPI001605B0BC|nr:aminotransferase class III-fold pyridoxal phosphate-dependent enzyme [Bradyrhizobium sp. CIR18]MBB4365219.1 adenosylmethionine-8-amino-7-oxononanoate aminotransferase [Bradyrhizobium sp. CIR18]
MKSPIWHPFTQHALRHEMTKVVRGEGAYLYTADDRRIIDAISSWWVVTHGHCHAQTVRAIQKQAGELNQIIFAGYTHNPAEEVAAELLKVVPRSLDHVFFSDSGSASVEVALKMALGYWHNSGEQRIRIVVMQHSYHGDTVGAMLVGARGIFNAAYGPLLFDVTTIPFPAAGREQAALDALECACRNEMPAAFIVEPLMLGAGGMLMYPPWVLKEMKSIYEASDVLLIADEIMTGWGRTGTLFACEQAGITPDIAAIQRGSREARFHSQQHSAELISSRRTIRKIEPMACSAAKANLDLWQDEKVRQRVASVAAMQGQAIEPFRVDPRFENVRRTGTVTALDLNTSDTGYLAGIGPQLQTFFKNKNLLLRPLGNTIYVMPPYCIAAADLDEIYAGIRDAADALNCDRLG